MPKKNNLVKIYQTDKQRMMETLEDSELENFMVIGFHPADDKGERIIEWFRVGDMAITDRLGCLELLKDLALRGWEE